MTMPKRSRYRALAVVLSAMALFAATFLPAASASPVRTPIASENVDLVAQIPDVPAIGGKIVGDTMYVTTLRGVRIYDVSLGVPVPMGAFELPHWQNESVDTNGKILLVAADHLNRAPNMLHVFDVSNRNVVVPLSSILVGAAHTATCIQDCRYAWVQTTSHAQVVDLTNPRAPRVIGNLQYGAHKTDVDATGIAWMSGGQPVGFDVRPEAYGQPNLLEPPAVAYSTEFRNTFIIHNSLRPNAEQATPEGLADSDIDPGEVLLVSEENWLATQNGFCSGDGRFQTGWYRKVSTRHTGSVAALDEFNIGQGTITDARKPIGATCSAHWFDEHKGVVAIGWYEQGVRFLDVSNPRDIRQIGWWMPIATEAWMAQMHEVTGGPTAGVYVYSFDVLRGIDVLRFTGKAGDRTELAPRYNDAPVGVSAPSRDWGYACRVALAA